MHKLPKIKKTEKIFQNYWKYYKDYDICSKKMTLIKLDVDVNWQRKYRRLNSRQHCILDADTQKAKQVFI